MLDLFSYCGYDVLIFAQRAVRGAPKKTDNTLDMNSVVMIIIGAAVIAVLATIAYYVVSNLRKNIKESDQPPSLSDHLTMFQDAKAEGNITDQEYNQVRAHLSKKIIRQVKENIVLDEPDDDTPTFIAK